MAGWSFLRQRESAIGTEIIRQWVHSVTAAYSPTAATVEKFAITRGPILVHLLYAEILTTLETTASNVSVVVNPTTGTSITIASTADGTGGVAGDRFLVEGDTTAVIVSATATFAVGTPVPFIVPIGGIDIIHAAAMTGTLRWHLFWEPLGPLGVVTPA